VNCLQTSAQRQVVFNDLTRMAEDLTIQPDLAEKWDYTPDLKTWTFYLRAGVKFLTAPPWSQKTSSRCSAG
jgi:ABC-type transport system substrate-binding protein